MMSRNAGDPGAVARAFLHALDQERWHDAAGFVAEETLADFHAWWTDHLATDAGQSSLDGADTVFPAAATLLGVASADEADRLSPTELLARFAENARLDATLARAVGSPAGEVRPVPSLVRRVEHISIYRVGGRRFATVGYRIEPNHFRTHPDSALHLLKLVETPGGWRVWDGDLSGTGHGHIRPPPLP